MECKKEELDLLKNAVDDKYGQTTKTVGQCKLLAAEITKTIAGKSISQKTIQRIWQQNNTNFSDYTLNILAEYIGHENYNAAIKDLTEKNAHSKFYSHSLAVGKHKLHDAMIIVLNQKKRDMTPEELADCINEQDLFERNDQTPLPAYQIKLRIEKKPKYFTYDEKTNLVSLKPAHRAPDYKQ